MTLSSLLVAIKAMIFGKAHDSNTSVLVAGMELTFDLLKMSR